MNSRNFRKYNIGRVVVAEKGKPYFFEITLLPESIDTPEVLYQILGVFKSYGLNILALKVSAPVKGEEIRVLLSADLAGSEHLVKVIHRDLMSLKHVVEVRYAPPLFDGVALDVWSHPLFFWGRRVVVISEDVFRTLIVAGFEKLGNGFGGILFYVFYQGGWAVFENWVSKLASRVENQVALFTELFRLNGFGVLEFRGFSGNKAVFRVYDGLEAKVLEGSSVEAELATRGLLAGFMAGVWKAPYGAVAVTETKCVRRGDPYCEIHVERRL
ncbi:hypothetical protein IG193_02515 [Infirmifilum lucidum]|uniref:ACT domain-containing protein n=1 Tax=Infirmifilum lucidum TaxID=2776706 RepID=A0A7L9FK88_9CREN|nr:hypothetical protein [Infirmifilum lucidum]QOJ79354.1 hypothetical protein IG193_02515 [Infirmifilum lucidum]